MSNFVAGIRQKAGDWLLFPSPAFLMCLPLEDVVGYLYTTGVLSQ